VILFWCKSNLYACTVCFFFVVLKKRLCFYRPSVACFPTTLCWLIFQQFNVSTFNNSMMFPLSNRLPIVDPFGVSSITRSHWKLQHNVHVFTDCLTQKQNSNRVTNMSNQFNSTIKLETLLSNWIMIYYSQTHKQIHRGIEPYKNSNRKNLYNRY